MNRLKRVAALQSKTEDRIKGGWLCGVEILSSRTSGTVGQREYSTQGTRNRKTRGIRNAEVAAAADGVYGDETRRLI